jgi:hypothetical protein
MHEGLPAASGGGGIVGAMNNSIMGSDNGTFPIHANSTTSNGTLLTASNLALALNNSEGSNNSSMADFLGLDQQLLGAGAGDTVDPTMPTVNPKN